LDGMNAGPPPLRTLGRWDATDPAKREREDESDWPLQPLISSVDPWLISCTLALPSSPLAQDEAHITYSAGKPPLLHLPLRFPASSSSSAPVLTAWSHLSLSLPLLLNYFSSPLLSSADRSRRPPTPLPDARAGRGSSWLAIEVFANCRLRRVWFSAERASGTPERGTEELALFAGEALAGEGEG
jgi:hypothetical protein